MTEKATSLRLRKTFLKGPSLSAGPGRGISEFESNLTYTVSYRIGKATLKNPVLKNNNNKVESDGGRQLSFSWGFHVCMSMPAQMCVFINSQIKNKLDIKEKVRKLAFRGSRASTWWSGHSKLSPLRRYFHSGFGSQHPNLESSQVSALCDTPVHKQCLTCGNPHRGRETCAIKTKMLVLLQHLDAYGITAPAVLLCDLHSPL